MATYRTRPAADAARLVAEGAQLVDVREDIEWASGSLPGAIHIPLGQLPDRLGELDPHRTVALLCRAGSRSAVAATFLAQHGFDDVVNLEGGLLAAARR